MGDAQTSFRSAPASHRREIIVIEFLAGIALLVLWIILQFVVQPATGWIHVALAAGVILVIRGIATSRWGTPGSR